MNSELLGILDFHPVLVDVGASGASPPIWNPIASRAVYVGFDPDERKMQDTTGGRYHRTIIVNKAVTNSPDSATTHFYLTKSPYCSSTLPPNDRVLSDYLYADLFTVERETDVPATTLEETLNSLQLSHIDWLKLDSQGIDLEILKSLSKEHLGQLLAVDIEPGLSEFYTGENLFTDLHSFLTDNGFWLSDINVKGSARMRRDTLESIASSARDSVSLQSRMKTTPGWVEARYLRELDYIESRDQHILLSIFALLDQQIGYTLDVIAQYRERFGDDAISQNLFGIACALLKPSLTQRVRGQIRQAIPASVKKYLRRRLGKP